MADLDQIVRAYNEACSSGTLEEVMAFFADDAVIYDLNHPPVVGKAAIGRFWGHVRAKWGGARWTTDAVITDGIAASVEWTMHGVTPAGPFAFHGVDTFRFDGGLITDIRQYWRFDPHALDSGLVGFPYPSQPG